MSRGVCHVTIRFADFLLCACLDVQLLRATCSLVSVSVSRWHQSHNTNVWQHAIFDGLAAIVAPALPATYQIICGDNRPVGLALYGRSNRKSVGSREAVPLSSAPPTSGI
eukprot:6184879-Pleurochrysis_carterae.AAC.1